MIVNVIFYLKMFFKVILVYLYRFSWVRLLAFPIIEKSIPLGGRRENNTQNELISRSAQIREHTVAVKYKH